MIRFVFRFFGLWTLAAGFVALVRDGTKSIAANAVFITRLGEDWNNLHPASQEAMKALIERYSGPWAWDLTAQYLLGAPTWLVLGLVGSLFILIGRKRKPLIGYGRD
jgi:hypothetical protein